MERVNVPISSTHLYQESPPIQPSFCKKIITIAQNFFSKKIIFLTLTAALLSPLIAIALKASFFVVMSLTLISIISIVLSFLFLIIKTEHLTEELITLRSQVKKNEETSSSQIEHLTEKLITLSSKLEKLENSAKNAQKSDKNSVRSTSSSEDFNELNSNDFNQMDIQNIDIPPNTPDIQTDELPTI